MAKITITIEDQPNGQVRILASPNVQQLIDLAKRDAGLTAAQGYALYALRQVREEAKRQERKATGLIIVPPKIGLS